MYIYEVLKELDDDELDDFVEARIDQLEESASKDKPILGYYAEANPKGCAKLDDDLGELTIRCFHKGYIKKDTKFVYGFSISPEGIVENEGSYYYLKDQQYIYDFCKFIRQFDIEDEYDLFEKILLFMRKYFGRIKKADRNDMFHMIYDKEGNSFPLKKEHDLNWFKGRGSAMCSEFATMAQNLLSVLGVESYIVLGAQKIGQYDVDSHAYNFVTFKEKNEDGELEDTSLLVDFSSFCNIYNFKREKVGESPFIGFLDEFDDDFLLRFLYEEEHIAFQDYNYAKVGNTTVQVLFDRDRDYFVNNKIIAEKRKVATNKKGR